LRVWVDLTNSPHAMLFAPIVRELQRRGDDVLVTARRFAHTVELAEQRFDDVRVVGRGAAKSLPDKVRSLQDRIRALRRVAKGFRPDVAVSHGSYDQVVAARTLGVPSLVSVDYEYQPANHLSFRLASRLLLPAAFEQADIDRRGGKGKTWRYDGLKEEVYLSGFVPSPDAREHLGITGHTGPVVTLRPPPEGALYHRGENPLYDTLVDSLRAREDVATLVLPRHPSQVEPLTRAIGGGGIRVLAEVVDGPDLIWWSDAMVSGGGTMNREAVALGTPVWTLFGGTMGGVDRRLIAAGRLHRLAGPDDLAGFDPVTRRRGQRPELPHDVLGQFVSAIDRTAARAEVA
jgi:predicted glycosyltransferase